MHGWRGRILVRYHSSWYYYYHRCCCWTRTVKSLYISYCFRVSSSIYMFSLRLHSSPVWETGVSVKILLVTRARNTTQTGLNQTWIYWFNWDVWGHVFRCDLIQGSTIIIRTWSFTPWFCFLLIGFPLSHSSSWWLHEGSQQLQLCKNLFSESLNGKMFWSKPTNYSVLTFGPGESPHWWGEVVLQLARWVKAHFRKQRKSSWAETEPPALSSPN